MRFWAFCLFFFALFPLYAGATVTVEPQSLEPGARQLFTISATANRQSPLAEIRLFVPNDVRQITPTIKAGWSIEIVDSGDDVQEIDWRGGSIPPGYRDTFSFEGSVSDGASALKWIVTETYADGTVVSWDSDPSAKKPNPAPQTDVKEVPAASDWYGKAALLVAALALVLGITSLLRHF